MNKLQDIWRRARQRQSLTPGERALLKLLEGLLCAALVAALPIVIEALGHGSVSWSDVARTALAASAVAVLLALAKYYTARGDPSLGSALAEVAAIGAELAGQTQPADGPPDGEKARKSS